MTSGAGVPAAGRGSKPLGPAPRRPQADLVQRRRGAPVAGSQAIHDRARARPLGPPQAGPALALLPARRGGRGRGGARARAGRAPAATCRRGGSERVRRGALHAGGSARAPLPQHDARLRGALRDVRVEHGRDGPAAACGDLVANEMNSAAAMVRLANEAKSLGDNPSTAAMIHRARRLATTPRCSLTATPSAFRLWRDTPMPARGSTLVLARRPQFWRSRPADLKARSNRLGRT